MTSNTEAFAHPLLDETLSHMAAWLEAHEVVLTAGEAEQVAAYVRETLPLFPSGGDRHLIFATGLSGVDAIKNRPHAADPRYWRLNLAAIGGEVAAELIHRGGYPTPQDDVQTKMGVALVKRAVGLVSRAHELSPERAAQLMRDHAAAVVLVYLDDPPAPLPLN